ncbi:MAG: SGNH/GDSL hydrolase family protein [Melioribacteraceae bacterium]|nr:SGNH/GDSL hydrolase family protein [Melioribacteraceae bacterium]
MKHLLCLLLFIYSFAIAAPGGESWIKDGDEVLFWGDSITDDGIYPRIIENYILTYHPDWNVTFTTLGWGGDRSSFYPRLERDVKLCKPTKVFIMLGMNDGAYKAFDQDVLDAYVDGIYQLLRILKEHSNPEVMLISATPFDLRNRLDIVKGYATRKKEVARIFYPATLRRLTKALQHIADREDVRYFDMYQAMTEVIEDLDWVSGDYHITAEGTHPNVDGQIFMGLKILDAIQASNDLMFQRIDAGSGNVDSSNGSSIEELTIGKGELSFVRQPERLPMPIYPSVRKTTLQVADFYQTWNRDLLVVTGLDSGWYNLSINNKLIDVVTSDELESGINLSKYPTTPMMLQAYQVFEATERRLDAFYAKWRYNLLKGVRSPKDFSPFLTDVNTEHLDLLEAEAFKEQHELNKPKSQKIEIKSVKLPDYSKLSRSEKCDNFLNDFVKISIEIDSKLLRSFEAPLCIRGNFTYAEQYQWAIFETKRYYTDIPTQMYDDGTHGDKIAGDGIYSLDLFVRKNSGTFSYFVQDGHYLDEYWIHYKPERHINSELENLTKIWGELIGAINKKGNQIIVQTDKDASLKWDKSMFVKFIEQ